MKKSKTKIGRNIRRIRKAQGMSLAQAASRIGRRRQQWQQWEVNTFAPTLDSLVLIASALGVSLAELLETEGDNNEKRC